MSSLKITRESVDGLLDLRPWLTGEFATMKLDDDHAPGTAIKIIKVVIVAVAIPFIALNVWAYLPYRIHSVSEFFNIPFIELGEAAPAHRFVTVIGTDLMFGWALTSVIVAMMERSMGHSWWRVALWVIPLNFIGNIIWALYLLLYLQQFRTRILADGWSTRKAQPRVSA